MASGISATTIYLDGSVLQIWGTIFGSDIVRSYTGGEQVCLYGGGVSRNFLPMVA